MRRDKKFCKYLHKGYKLRHIYVLNCKLDTELLQLIKIIVIIGGVMS